MFEDEPAPPLPDQNYVPHSLVGQSQILRANMLEKQGRAAKKF